MFLCEVEPADSNEKWFHNETEVSNGKKYILYTNGNKRSLTIKECEDDDNGTVRVTFCGINSDANLEINNGK